MRYIKKLELRDISLANSMISLGSCTMKLNAAALMQPLSLAGFQNMHPFAPADQAEGYLELIAGLEKDLATITGFAACSLQPNSGAAGEYTGLMVIRAYHQSRGQGYRNVVLIPASAHGTNPASAAMAGMKIVTVACDERGNIDVADLEAKAKEHAVGTVRPDGHLPLDARRLREPHPRDRRRRPRRRRDRSTWTART